MAATPPSAAGARRVLGLDGLRGLAALAVLVFHAWLYSLPEPDASARSSVFDYAVHEMRLGLVLFFALSGFVLFRPWVRSALDGTPRPRLRRYLSSRARRILPAYYAALAGSILLLWPLAGADGVRLPPAEEVWRFFVFAQNYDAETVMTLNPPMWTLAIEMSFYLALPVLGLLALRLRRRSALLALTALLAAGGLWFTAYAQARGLPLTWRKTLASMLPYFAAGMAAAVIGHGRTLSRGQARALIAAGLALVAANAVALSLLAAGEIRAPALFVVRDFPASLGFGALLLAVAAAPPGRLLASRPVVALGTVSYGLYLWNVPLAMWARGQELFPSHAGLAVLVLLPATLVLATLSWVLVERRWLAVASVDAPEPRPADRVDRRGATPRPGRTPGPARPGRHVGGHPPRVGVLESR